MKLMSLGLFIFERATAPFDEREERASWDHASAERVGARPALQFTGPGEEIQTLAGCLYPEAGASYTALATLKEMAETGEAYPLTEGTGTVLGNFVITDLDQRKKYFIDNGAARATDFNLTLKRKS